MMVDRQRKWFKATFPVLSLGFLSLNRANFVVHVRIGLSRCVVRMVGVAHRRIILL